MNEHQPEWAKRSGVEKTVEEILRDLTEASTVKQKGSRRPAKERGGKKKPTQKGS